MDIQTRNDPTFRIAIDARPLAGSPCGYTIYITSVIACLKKAGFAITLLTNHPISDRYPEASGIDQMVFGSPSGLRWENMDLPRVLAKEHYDIYFTAANRGIPFRKRSQTRYVLCLYDIIPYLLFRSYFVDDFRAWLTKPERNRETISQLISLFRADAIITISQRSALDIRRVFGRRNVFANLIRLKEVEPKVGADIKDQFVYLGGMDARKKPETLLKAFSAFAKRHPSYKLALVGANYSPLMPLIEALGLEERVVITGYVDHDTKFRILGESRAMVYPSLYEGYGMAIAEAFQAGIPVIAGCGGAQAEVGGDGLRAVDPNSPQDIDAAMEDMLDPVTRAAWIAKGKAQLAVLTDPAIEQRLVDYFLKQGRLARKKRRR